MVKNDGFRAVSQKLRSLLKMLSITFVRPRAALFKPGHLWSKTMVLGQFRRNCISVENVIDNIATASCTFQTRSEMVRNDGFRAVSQKLQISVENVIDNIATASCTFQTRSEMVRNDGFRAVSEKLQISVENVIDNIATASCTFQTRSETMVLGQFRKNCRSLLKPGHVLAKVMTQRRSSNASRATRVIDNIATGAALLKGLKG